MSVLYKALHKAAIDERDRDEAVLRQRAPFDNKRSPYLNSMPQTPSSFSGLYRLFILAAVIAAGLGVGVFLALPYFTTSDLETPALPLEAQNKIPAPFLPEDALAVPPGIDLSNVEPPMVDPSMVDRAPSDDVRDIVLRDPSFADVVEEMKAAPLANALPLSRARGALGQDQRIDMTIMSSSGATMPPPKAVPIIEVTERNIASTALFDAERSLAARNYEQALQFYTAAMITSPKDQTAIEGKAYVLQRLGRHEESIPLWRQLLRLDPLQQKWMTNYVIALGATDNTSAFEELRAFSAKRPEFARAPAELAQHYRRQGDLFMAENSMKQALSQQPDQPEFLYHYAIILDEAGRGAEALYLYRNLLQTFEQWPAALRAPTVHTTIKDRVAYLARGGATNPVMRPVTAVDGAMNAIP
jgi:tetratricopeptide (TPR) repeat protein